MGCGNGLPGFDAYDVGIVVLDIPVPINVVNRYSLLPTVDTVDTLKVRTTLTHVGYGVQEQTRGGGPPVWTGQKIRLYAPSKLLSKDFTHSDLFIKHTSNEAQGKGGTTFGDSGGPILIGSTDTILALTSYGPNGNCAGVSYSQRVDIPKVLNWINTFLP
jgi:hypothetical protein